NSKWYLIAGILAAFIIGFLIRGGGSGTGDPAGHDHSAEAGAGETQAQTWTCSMHPQVRQPKPGKCPICFMDLVPIESEGGDDLGPRQLKLSPNAMKLAEIRTASVQRQFVATDIRMVGKVTYDETRLGYITSRVPGRLDRLYVDYTGVPVKKGDHLVSLYSPDLITAQQELLQASKTFKQFGTGKEVVAAVRDKLKLWGLSPQQIAQIEKRGTPADHLTINSPMSGVVINKNALEGMYVTTGTRIYTIADLSHAWVKLDAYESDLTWIRFGQTVEFESEAYPGDKFEGQIAFIDPVLDPKTQTVKVRVNVPNPQLKLKPGMFVRAVVRSKLSVSGKVMDSELAKKWICSMHPEVSKDGPGKCTECGMPLVKAESLGFIAAGSVEDTEAPLVIPASAPLITGTRAVVYVAVKDKEGVFEGREIVLGPRTGDFYLVKEGLEEGEQVVVNGAFKIDSDLQIQAKPSMMNPESETDKETEAPTAKIEIVKIDKSKVPDSFRQSAAAIVKAYFDIQYALSDDDLKTAKTASTKLLETVTAADMKQLSGNAHMEWMRIEKKITAGSKALSSADDINAARVQLEILTAPMESTVTNFAGGNVVVYRIHCPMAFNNKGAFWLQADDDTRNPYFGASMLKCQDSIEPLK
ncbi:MAG: DUF3347 domain-containing protein, partial [bacterium]|nr:DUF3347 domain-containing protein [bacterium]